MKYLITIKKYKKSLLSLFVLLLIVISISNYTIQKNAKNKTYSTINSIQKNKVGLVLGTSKYLKSGALNLYFKYRIDATVELYKNNKIDFILISGDNGNEKYDEPTDFKNELISEGVPANKIFLDYAGFRTLDSILRAKLIFGLDQFTIISQQFHNERALYLANKNGINAIAYNAKDVSKRYGIKVKIREYFARTKVFLDILFKVKPKFLGPKIEIK
ncbi:YdcF family protein [Flavobacterium sediminilitoris]|uniref:YdcF family protein n=1 Tax=Flavobacterium sediminilitoris TaxID=2024526 RepID=A0ABY4HL87_9FLAO|nr:MULTISPECIES: ElyC/SanA/YdcF family protein [Flavobacterium]UOX33460.1 YdcF family protein [Flavobacterium sediminilitoris]